MKGSQKITCLQQILHIQLSRWLVLRLSHCICVSTVPHRVSYIRWDTLRIIPRDAIWLARLTNSWHADQRAWAARSGSSWACAPDRARKGQLCHKGLPSLSDQITNHPTKRICLVLHATCLQQIHFHECDLLHKLHALGWLDALEAKVIRRI